ncbi:alpha/beta fold hydrolase [Variovorax sp. RA8]|uniref:alpha/beta fold hydrolase n=1 Tax=Variovorax sp. (strain JCM 16519 / RA8) TaxID=662548 RepID=UPI0013197B80|nr:alpha/beta fold hydrolase [Variovorax sp. RA8]VTU21308.1 Homoserine O-acetyltransferase [Variovorax sp. RA8]
MMHRARHPPLAPGHIDRPHQWAHLGDLPLESGEVIRDYRQCYVTHGTLDRRRPRVALLLPAIGATHHRLDFLIGRDRALDPAHWFIVVADPLGNGLSTSPSNSKHQPWEAFPRFCIRDMIAAQRRLLTEVLGIETAAVVIGASMGGMQALQWTVSHPGFFESVVALTPLARTGPWTLAANAAARAALMADPAWNGRRFTRVPERGWRAWAAVQQVLTNRTPRGLAADFAEPRAVLDWMDALAARACASGPDPHDFLYQSWAYDAHDVGDTQGWHGDTEGALGAIHARTLLLTPPLDLYNPMEEALAAAQRIPRASHVVIPSLQGHQAANTAHPEDVAFVNRTIREFLA